METICGGSGLDIRRDVQAETHPREMSRSLQECRRVLSNFQMLVSSKRTVVMCTIVVSSDHSHHVRITFPGISSSS